MKVVVIAAIFNLFLSAAFLAQQGSNVRLTVTVTDIAGAVIPGASVWTNPPPAGEPSRAAITNSQGQVDVDVAPGSYNLRITAPGFKILQIKPLNIDLLKGSEQSITLVLQISGVGWGPVFESYEPELATTPVDVPCSLLLQPLLQFPLPSVRPRRRFL